ncbi:hypothetical protein K2173_021441 [Erythroxylum novogranatense]|uniref:HTH myb-type domain-containing protein n=1 Tax=Erythroxylum novogranatense TaxID=1862640 RepID=A0AAV8TXM0_9ROSI|nr:hypothetical protein K2173_021441 [Erythroxylum novogranatense]
MELSLGLSLSYTPKTINDFIWEASRIEDGTHKLSKLADYVKRLEEEMRKIDAFKRELPLSLLLLNDAIARLKEESMQCEESNDRAMDMKPPSLERNCDKDEKVKLEDDTNDKRMWMSSVQLWNSNDISPDCQKKDEKSELKQRSEEEDNQSTCENPIQLCNYRNSAGSFVLVPELEETGKKEEKEVVSQVTGLSLMTPVSELGSCNWISKGNANKQRIQSIIQQHQGNKKQRRCWSPELHRRFIDSLELLGGPKVATPKQIRELMRVDGLTNDEVKSHLQKYRLHIRKHPGLPTAASNGLWMATARSKPSTTESNSPQGPLHGNGSAKYTSSTGADSMRSEDDEKSESHSWK